MSKNVLKIEPAAESNVFLVTGELANFSNQINLAVGYVIADDAKQAASEQVRVQPNLKVTGVVSLAELKAQVSLLEKARAGDIPALICGSWRQM